MSVMENQTSVYSIIIYYKFKAMRKPFYFTVCFIITSAILAASCTDDAEPRVFSLLEENRIEPLANTWKAIDTETTCIKFIPPIIKCHDDPEEPTTGCVFPVNIDKTEPKVKTPYNHVEQMPQFPKGHEAMKEYIYSNLHYPKTAMEQGIQGRVIVRFIVTKNGDIKDIQILRGLSPEQDREAIRVVDCMPKWEPGKQNGEAVDVYFTLPVTFRIPKED
jgi:TonB family protein